MNHSQQPIIGLALGSGSSRGWAHIGIIGALSEMSKYGIYAEADIGRFRAFENHVCR